MYKIVSSQTGGGEQPAWGPGQTVSGFERRKCRQLGIRVPSFILSISRCEQRSLLYDTAFLSVVAESMQLRDISA